MRGFIRYTVHAAAAAFVFLVLGFVFLPFFLLVPFALLSILAYPLFKLMMPEFLSRRGY